MSGLREGLRHYQSGAVAIEFAFVFPVFLGIVYAMIAYALAFLVLQSFTYASEEALRAALAHPCDGTCTPEELEPEVKEQVEATLSWLSVTYVTEATSGDDFFSCTPENLCTVRLSAGPLIPSLNLPVFGEVPRLPAELVGKASLRM